MRTPDGVTLDVPAGAVAEPVRFEYVPLADPPGDGTGRKVHRAFDLAAFTVSDGASVSQFAQLLVLTVTYDPSAVQGSMAVAHYDVQHSLWIDLTDVVVDAASGTVRGTTDHFTAFGTVENFDVGSGTVLTGPILFADALASLNAWTTRAGAPTVSGGVAAVPSGALMTVTHSDNYYQDVAVIMPLQLTDKSGSNFGALVFGYKSATDYWLIAKNPNPGAGVLRFVLSHCTATPCGSPPPPVCAGCEATGTFNPSPSAWLWFEVELTASGADTQIVARLYTDSGACGTPPCSKGTLQQSLTYTAPAAAYSGGQIGVAAIDSQWNHSKPQPRGILPAGWGTCMESQYTSTKCNGSPGIIWDGITAAPSSPKSIRVFSGSGAYTGYAYESKLPLAAGTYGVRALIRPDNTGGIARVRVTAAGGAYNAGPVVANAETGPDLATNASHECVAATLAGWWDCQGTFTLTSDTNVEVRLIAEGAAGTPGTANFDDVVVGAVPASVPTLYTRGATGDNKTVFGLVDDLDAAAGVQIRVQQDPGAPLPDCAGCQVKVYDTVGGTTTLIGTYSVADFNSGTNTLQTPSTGVLHTYSAVYIDGAGIRGVASSSPPSAPAFEIDVTPPTISYVISPLANANGWNNSDVTVTFTCNDAQTGIAVNGCAGSASAGSGTAGGNTAAGVDATGTWTLTAETTTAGVVVTGTATDKGGNTATTTTPAIKIDKTAPAIDTTITGTLGLNGWYTSDITVTFSCADALSGMAATGCVASGADSNTTGQFSATGVINVDTTGKIVTGQATDLAGNMFTTSTAALRRDTVAPESAITMIGNQAASPSPSFNATTYTDLSTFGIEGTASDATSGIADGTDSNAAQAVQVTLQRASDSRYWDPGSGTWVVGVVVIARPATFVAGTTWAWTVPGALLPSGTDPSTGWAETSYTVTSVAQDEAGWVETAAAVATFTVDATPPVGTLVVNCLPVVPGANCVGGVKYVKTTSVPLTLTATDGVNVAAYVVGQSGLGGTAAQAQTDATGKQGTAAEVAIVPVTASYTNAGASVTLVTTGDGLYYVAVEYKDTAGNWCCMAPGVPVADSVVLDETAPVVSVVTPVVTDVYPAGVMTIEVDVADVTSGIGVAPVVVVQQAGGAPSTAATLVGCAPGLPQVNVVVRCTYEYTVTAGVATDGVATITVTAEDRALNTATANGAFTVDTQPPTIVVASAVRSPSGSAYSAGTWSNEDVVVTFTCNDLGTGIATNGCAGDATSGSGVPGGPAAGGTAVDATWTVSAETAGLTVTGRAEDKAGNVTTTSFGPIRIDKTLPDVVVSSISPAVPDGLAGWYVSNVTVTFDCSDPTVAGVSSGMLSGGCVSSGADSNTPGTATATGVLSVDTTGKVVTGTATDNAGNQRSVDSPVLKLDKTLPVSRVLTAGGTSPAHGASFNAATIGGLTSISGDASDATSGVSTVVITLGRSIDGFYWDAASGTWIDPMVDPIPLITTSLVGPQPGTRTWETSQPMPSGTSSASGWLETTYTVRSQSRDVAGNLEAFGVTAAVDTKVITFTVDATPPAGTLEIPCPPASPAAVCVGAVKYVKTTSVPVALSATDGNRVAAYVLGQSGLGGTAADAQAAATARQGTDAVNVSPVPPTTYNATVTFPLVSSGDGAYYVAVEYKDLAGNWCCEAPGAPVADLLVLDTVLPSATILSPAPTALFTAGVMSIVVRVSDLTSGIGAAPLVRVRQNGVATYTTATLTGCTAVFPVFGADVDCTYEYTVTASATTDGTASIVVDVDDQATNRRTVNGSFQVDTQPPAITVSAKKADGSTYTAGTWSIQDVTVTFLCSDATGLKPSPDGCKVTPLPGVGTGPGGNGTSSATWTVNADTAGVTIGGQAEDVAGNTATASFGPVLVDKTRPVSTISTPADLSVHPGTSFPNIAGGASDALSGLAALALTIQRLDTNEYWNGTSWGGTFFLAPTTFDSVTGAWDRTTGLPSGAMLPEGDFRICSRATDVAGNVESPLTCVSITLNVRPHVVSTSPASGAIVPRSHDVVTITFNEPVYRCANPGVDPCVDTGSGLVAVAGTDYGTLFSVKQGATTLSATATIDAAGKVVTITLAPNALLLGGGPLDENTTYTIEVLGCAPIPCKTGILDNLGGSLGDTAGVALSLDTRTFKTPDPANAPVSTSVTWPGPAAGSIASLPTARRDVAAATAGGRFYVTGGLAADGTTILATNQAYTPATNTWATVSSLPTARYAHSAAAASGGFYILGGISGSTTLSDVVFYNAASNSWTSIAPLPQARRYAAAATLEGKVYLAGGQGGDGFQKANVYRYDPVAKAWSEVAPLPGGPRARLTLTATGSGASARLWAIGGVGTSQGMRVEVYDPNTNTWSVGPSLPAARSLHGTAVLNGYLYVIGGFSGTTPTSTVYYYDPLLETGGSWASVNAASLLPADGRAAFGGHVAVLDATASPNQSGILIAGGATTTMSATSEVLASAHG